MARDNRIMGMMFVLGVLAAILMGHQPHAGPVTLAAIIIGGFSGWAWDHWMPANPISFEKFCQIRNGGMSDGIEIAAQLIVDCAEVSGNKEQALHHAALIRQLKPKRALESPAPRG